MSTTPPAAGDIITKPRGIYIDFRNISGRKIKDTDINSLTNEFIKVSRAVGADAAITCDRFAAEAVPGDKRSEKLVPGGLYDSKNEKLRYLRLAFTETAKDQTAPLSGSLILDLRDRTAKSAEVIIHAPNSDATTAFYDLFNALEDLQGKGLLNNINMKLTTRDRSYSMSYNKRWSNVFSLRF